MCGEQYFAVLSGFVNVGSSPRVRGTADHTIAGHPNGRFIPACAGNRTNGHSFFPYDFGSSPRVRGTETRSGRYHALGRFIPACAGNRLPWRGQPVPLPVHPRVCGEQIPERRGPGLRGGSSPRVRGTASEILRTVLLARFIPACAGNRLRHTWHVVGSAVHPRVCGEQLGCGNGSHYWRGSSPRVRGTAETGWSLTQTPRFIPACAGNSGCPLL